MSKFFACSFKGSFDLRYDLFEEEIKKGVKLFILNVPSNPTGVIMQEKELVKLLEASLKYNFYILLDECYRRMLYDGHTFPSPLKLFPEAKSRLRDFLEGRAEKVRKD